MAVGFSSTSNDCTGSTCMKWAQDGSLSEHDHAALMRRLCSVDPELAHTDACTIALPADAPGLN